jgi:hypothetical protein
MSHNNIFQDTNVYHEHMTVLGQDEHFQQWLLDSMTIGDFNFPLAEFYFQYLPNFLLKT